jgi:hypothetical protein
VANWVTISSLATAGGTCLLAVATFGSVRSANRAARVAEVAMLASVRPVLTPSRLEDPMVKVGFVDNHWVHVGGGRGTIEVTDEVIYLTMSLRNAGSGIAVLHGWRIEETAGLGAMERPPLAEFRHLTRDLYIPAGDAYFWQGAIRETDDRQRSFVIAQVEARERIIIDLLYGDHQGGQRVISRIGMQPGQDGSFLLSLARHWNVDRPDPR